ncbi:hypothetical protein AKJ65_07540 [candidate division MSBL1 archaeon SCGC-AAA259E19]|uniref:Uncharacterized protein n=1 Tax=candidate division MSBL1 archaeon SCGC-AAA259E19 TaxID=1698264 RepID=A0A133UE98_9EURY|nr:hypothetical protein AKJ65_07540 [candidate division MSBL1 archaeon SCGC-AAA259E19]
MLGPPEKHEKGINRGFGAPSGSYPQDRGRVSLGALIFFLSLLIPSASFALPSAGGTNSEGGVTTSVHLSGSGRIEMHAVWNGEFYGDLGVKEADWSARLSSPAPDHN